MPIITVQIDTDAQAVVPRDPCASHALHKAIFDACGIGFADSWDDILSAASQPEHRCSLCDNTGDIHTTTGEWRGECPHCRPEQAQQSEPSLTETMPYGHDIDAYIEEFLKAAGSSFMHYSLPSSRERMRDVMTRAMMHMAKTAPRPVPTGGWQPIENAPNYKYVLVHYAKHITDLDQNWTWDENSERTFVAKRENDLWRQDFGPDNFVIVEPTHWMPLPEPPTGLQRPPDPEGGAV